MNITQRQLEQQLRALGSRRVDLVSELAHEGENDGIGPSLLLALGSRETNMKNIVGDGGHGRGWLQIDDRFHHDFLATHRGCESGRGLRRARGRAAGARAVAHGRHDLCDQAAAQQHELRPQPRRPGDTVLRFAVAAYNAGAGGALRGFRAGDVDRHTTGRDCARDVLGRKTAIARILEREPAPV